MVPSVHAGRARILCPGQWLRMAVLHRSKPQPHLLCAHHVRSNRCPILPTLRPLPAIVDKRLLIQLHAHISQQYVEADAPASKLVFSALLGVCVSTAGILMVLNQMATQLGTPVPTEHRKRPLPETHKHCTTKCTAAHYNTPGAVFISRVLSHSCHSGSRVWPAGI